MQSAPTSTLVVAPATAAAYFLTLPWYLQLALGMLLVGLSASIATAQLRGAFPAQRVGWQRALHYLYPSGLGGSLAIAAPFLFPGFEFSIRAMLGVVAPYVLGPLYDYLKKKYLGEIGNSLPSSADLIKVEAPASTPSTEGKPQ